MTILVPALRFYLVLWLLAMGIIFLQGRLSWSLFFPTERAAAATCLLWGLGGALLLIGLSLYASRHFGWARQLDQEFRKILVPLGSWQIGAIALFSGTAEEAFFRGVIQPLLGVVPTSLLFGAVHLIPRKPFLPWAAYAAFAGFLFGCLFELSGTLFPNTLSHVAVNFVMIWLLNRSDPAPSKDSG